MLDVINAFETVTGQKLNYEITGRRDGDVPRLYSSSDLAKEKLGWTAEKGLNDMINSAWTWEKKFRSEQN